LERSLGGGGGVLGSGCTQIKNAYTGSECFLKKEYQKVRTEEVEKRSAQRILMTFESGGRGLDREER